MSRHQSQVDIDYMREALRLAWLRRGFTAPNPAVGAVLVKEGTIIAKGLHWASGCAHAEVAALDQLAPQAAHGSTLYVSLEPCCHFGKTPPCTERIVASGVSRVVYGLRDPNPVVAGKGEQALLASGIACERLELPEGVDFYRSYAYWQQSQRPWVTAKLALSLDARIAGEGGQRVAITGAELGSYTQQWRKRCDAILTTEKTIRCDDPQLNVRLGDEILAKPVYILDAHLATSPQARIFETAARVTLLHAPGLEHARFTERGIACVAIPQEPTPSKLSLLAVLQYIGGEGVQDLWVEAGGQCFQALCEQGLLQRGLIYLAAKKLGRQAQAAFTPDFDVFTQAPKMSWQMFGSDALCQLDF